MLHRHARLDQAHSLHFITTVTRIRGNWFVEPSVCEAILNVFEKCRSKYELDCLGYVLMPDHLHALLLQANDDTAVSGCVANFKKFVSRFCRPQIYPGHPLWDRYFDDVPVPGPDAACTKINYMHYNPVKRGIVPEPEMYVWSSAQDFAGIHHGIVTISRFL